MIHDELLDAQVRWALAELDGPRMTEIVREEVRWVRDLAERTTLVDVVDAAALRTVLSRVALELADAPMTAGIGTGLLLDLDAHLRELSVQLGEVVDRAVVDAAVARAVRVRGAADGGGDALLQSPTATQLIVKVVSAIVADVLNQNRAIAEKLPGMTSLLSLGTGAASRMGRLGRAAISESPIERLIGDAVGSGAQATVRRTRTIVGEVITPEAVHQVVMELWDSSADRPVADLMAALDPDDVGDLLDHLTAIAASARAGAAAPDLVDAAVTAFLDRHGAVPLRTLMDGVGLTEEVLVADAVRLIGPAVAHLRETGELEGPLRRRLAPFWGSPEVAAILSAEE